MYDIVQEILKKDTQLGIFQIKENRRGHNWKEETADIKERREETVVLLYPESEV